MAAYLIADVEVADLERYGGRILVAGGHAEAPEGEWLPRRLVVLEFPSADHARRWHASPEYAEIAPIRHRHATTHYPTLVEGWIGS